MRALYFQESICIVMLPLFFYKEPLSLLDHTRLNVLNLHRIDLARKYYTHWQREIEKEKER